MKKILLAFLFGLFVISSASALVDFGEFKTGTLYTPTYNLSGQFYATNAYPVHEIIKEFLVCKNITVTSRERVVVNGRTKWVNVKNTVEKCSMKKLPTNKKAPGCMNSNGIFTNAIYSDNFEYSLDGENWSKVPNKNHPLAVNGFVQFRISILEPCTEFEINKAIVII